MSLLDTASRARGISSSGEEANLSLRQRGTKHLTRLVLTLYAECATLNIENKRKESV